MVFFNYALRKLNAKIVYYGPGLCGKTTNLQWIHDHFEGGQKGKMISLATEGDRTIFFDLLPLEIGTIRGMEVTLQLYTVPGQVHYNSTRQLVLRGADGVVFVADSQRTMQQSNIDSLKNLQENLMLQGISLEKFPHAIQFNKRDLRDLLSPEELNQQVNPYGMPWFEAVATDGAGVQETLEGIVKLVMRSLKDRYETMGAQGPQPVAGPTAPQAPAAPGSQAGPWPVPPKGPSAPAAAPPRPAAPAGAPRQTQQPPPAAAPPPRQQQAVPPPPKPFAPDEEPTQVYSDRPAPPPSQPVHSEPAPAAPTQTPAPPVARPVERPQVVTPPKQPPVTPPSEAPAFERPPVATHEARPVPPPPADDDFDPHAVTATGSLFGDPEDQDSDTTDGAFPAFDDGPVASPADDETPPVTAPGPGSTEPPVAAWESEPAPPVLSRPAADPEPAEPVRPAVDPAATQRDQIQAPGPFARAMESDQRGAGNVDDLVASVLNRAASAAVEAQRAEKAIDSPPTKGGGDREAVVIGDQEPFGDPVRTRATDLTPAVAPEIQTAPDDDSGDDANSLAVRLTGRGAIVERGQVSNLDIEVPVPGTLVGNKRVTLQLRLTLTPVEEDADGGAS
jgi:signal recognition particle receptor subunit beta